MGIVTTKYVEFQPENEVIHFDFLENNYRKMSTKMTPEEMQVQKT